MTCSLYVFANLSLIKQSTLVYYRYTLYGSLIFQEPFLIFATEQIRVYMLLWIVLYAVGAAITLTCAFFLIKKIQHFAIIQKIAHNKKLLLWIIPLLILVVLGLILGIFFGVVNILVCFFALIGCWLLCDFVFWVIKKVRKKSFARYYQGACAILLAAVYLCCGFYNAHNIVQTHYTVQNDKNDAKMRIVQISDSHLGLVLKSDTFYDYMDEIQSQNPDLIAITGDYVDDDTKLQDLITGCKALAKLKVPLGIWYIYGNHDKGYYSEEHKGWKNTQLVEYLEQAGVHIMEDSVAQLTKDFTLVGRKDASGQMGLERKSSQELMKGQDTSKFSIMLDHQPIDYDNQEAAGVDLVLSGHTHGGQLFPINWSVCVFGKNCMAYGYKKQGNTNFIVSSGIGDWKVQFKTGCLAEYVVIDIE